VIFAPEPPGDWEAENIISTLQVSFEKTLTLIYLDLSKRVFFRGS
jgi:hypothetical protein